MEARPCVLSSSMTSDSLTSVGPASSDPPPPGTQLEGIISDFELLEDWEDRYRYVIELGRALPPFPEPARTDANKVRGCASQVWLATAISADKPQQRLTFQGDSDAHIVRGLIAILLAVYSGKICERDPRHRRQCHPAHVGLGRPSLGPALQRLDVHGRAYPRRCARGELEPERSFNAASCLTSHVLAPLESASSKSGDSLIRPVVARAPMPDPASLGAFRVAGTLGAGLRHAVVHRQSRQRQQQDHLARPGRPATSGLDAFQSFHEAADIQTGCRTIPGRRPASPG